MHTRNWRNYLWHRTISNSLGIPQKSSANHPRQTFGAQAPSEAGERPKHPNKSQPPIRSQHPILSSPPFWSPPGNSPPFVQQSSSNPYQSQSFECRLSRNCPSKIPNTPVQISIILLIHKIICRVLVLTKCVIELMSTSFCSLSSWFTSSCAYHLITVTTFALITYHSLYLSLQT